MDKYLVNGKEYVIQKLLGKGKGGYSYLASFENNLYVLKKIHHELCEYYIFGDDKLEIELTDYNKLNNIGIPMPKLIDVDKPHDILIKEFIEGPTILELVYADKMKAEYFQQINDICKLVYSANTNIDYFPSNFIVKNDTLYYVDYECNEYIEQWNFENWGITYWSKTKEFLEYVEKFHK